MSVRLRCAERVSLYPARIGPVPPCRIRGNRSAPEVSARCSCGRWVFCTRQLWHALLPQLRNCVEEISDLKFSPDDHKLAVGSFDGVIDVYDVLNAFR